MTDLPDTYRGQPHVAPRSTTKPKRANPLPIALAVIAAVGTLGVLAYRHFDGPNVTVQKGDNLVAIFGGDYERAIRYADRFDLRIVKTPLGELSQSISAKEALAADTDRNLVSVHICPGDQVDGQFNWRYVKAAGSACHRGTR